jgi:hypothetical protein
MESGLSFTSPAWRSWQRRSALIGRHISARSAEIALWTAQTTARISSEISRRMPSPKSYPSQRPCPVCDERTFYVGSWTTFFTGLYTRTCPACGYFAPRKVKMIKQL